MSAFVTAEVRSDRSSGLKSLDIYILAKMQRSLLTFLYIGYTSTQL